MWLFANGRHRRGRWKKSRSTCTDINSCPNGSNFGITSLNLIELALNWPTGTELGKILSFLLQKPKIMIIQNSCPTTSRLCKVELLFSLSVTSEPRSPTFLVDVLETLSTTIFQALDKILSFLLQKAKILTMQNQCPTTS